MPEIPTRPTAGPSHAAVEIGVAVAIAAVRRRSSCIGSLQVGIGWGAEGPEGRLLPVLRRLLIVVSRASINLVPRAHGQFGGRLFASWAQLRQVLSVVIPTAIYVARDPVDRHLRRRRRC